jgi:hypothetical protein
MQQNNSTSALASSEKRNLGFVKLRRGLREHLHRSRMSSNASTLFVWLLLWAYYSGPKRGCVEANIDDLMLGLGWSRSMVKRSVDELASKGYISFNGAANQHELGEIRILKFDVEERDSARSTSEPSRNSEISAELSARLTAQSTTEPSSEPSNPSNLQSRHDLQVPKNAVEVKKEKKGKADAVRRPFDAELRASPKSFFSPSEKRKKLEARLAGKLLETGNTLDRDLNDEEREAFAYLRYKPKDEPRNLPNGFVWTLFDVYDDHKDDLPLPGNLCSKIIDHCMAKQESCKTIGSDPSEYYYPLDFVEHRDRLREQERRAEKNGGRP